MCVNKNRKYAKTAKPDTCCPFSHTNRDTTLQYCFVWGGGGGEGGEVFNVTVPAYYHTEYFPMHCNAH